MGLESVFLVLFIVAMAVAIAVRHLRLPYTVGLAVGFVVSAVLRRVDDPMIEISLTTIAAYGAFVVAENVGYSGVIATAASGIVRVSYHAAAAYRRAAICAKVAEPLKIAI